MTVMFEGAIDPQLEWLYHIGTVGLVIGPNVIREEDLTPARVLAYFTSDRVMKTKAGVAKARPTFLKTQRVLRLALVWAQEAGLIERAPLPEDAAAY